MVRLQSETAIFLLLIVVAGTTFYTIIIHALALTAIVGVVRFKNRHDLCYE